MLVVLLCTAIWFKTTYPFGVSHCCWKTLQSALRAYADAHDGWFPHGGTSPEASFSMLCSNEPALLSSVHGKTISEETAQKEWAANGRLDSETCGWHYVEGLNTNDAGDIAVLWDKSWGLGHNGQRIRGFGREVVFVNGSGRSLLLKDWPQFARDQKEKISKVISARTKGAPPIRWSDEETLGTNRFPSRE